MAHFYGNMKGHRGAVTRAGTQGSGLEAHVRGWSVGARVYVAHIAGRDVVQIYRTSGSNGNTSDTLIAEYDAETLPGSEGVKR